MTPERFFEPPELGAATVAGREQALDTDPRAAGVTNLSLSNLTRTGWWRWSFAIMIGALVIVLLRLLFLQGVQGNSLRDRAEQNRVRIQIVPAPRGSILDRHGASIAENAPNFVLSAIPVDVPSESAAYTEWLATISQLTGLDQTHLSETVEQAGRASSQPVVLRDHLTYDEALPLIVSTNQLPGVSVTSIPTRMYPLTAAAGTLVGYTGVVSPADLEARPELNLQSQVGKSGLERQYDEILSGQDGRQEVERNVQNQRLEILHAYAPVPGTSLELTIDRGLQERMYDQLRRMVSQTHSPGGAAVALDPRNGEVLALVSAPGYDNNWFTQGGFQTEIQRTLTDASKPLLNRAIGGQYPSGSIIKPMVASAALEEGIVTPSTTIASSGGIRIGRDFFPDWQAGGHGATNVAKAIAESVNTYFYTIGGGDQDRPGLGVDRIVRYLERFGWGDQLGIDLPGETGGFLPTADWRENERPSPWRLGDTYHLSIGQGDISVTPLQVASAIAAIANNGTLYKPYLVKRQLNPDGQELKVTQPTVIREIGLSNATLSAVRNGMRQGVLDGSSRSLQSLPFSTSGKTGTAQFGSEGKTHAWFTAFAPYENPEIVLAVIVEGGGEGHAAALPVAKDALEWYFRDRP